MSAHSRLAFILALASIVGATMLQSIERDPVPYESLQLTKISRYVRDLCLSLQRRQAHRTRPQQPIARTIFRLVFLVLERIKRPRQIEPS